MLTQKTEGLAVQCRFAARTYLKLVPVPLLRWRLRAGRAAASRAWLLLRGRWRSSGGFWNGTPAGTMLLPLTDELLNI